MANLPDGAFLTSINGKQCTAVPRNARSPPQQTSEAAEPARTTTEAAQPTENGGDENRQTAQPDPTTEQPPQQAPPTTQSVEAPPPDTTSQPPPVEEAPEPTIAPPVAAPAPTQDESEDTSAVISESDVLDPVSSSPEVEPPAPVAPTTTASSVVTSIPPIQTQPPPEEDQESVVEDPQTQDSTGTQNLVESSTSSSPPAVLESQVANPPATDARGPVPSPIPVVSAETPPDGTTISDGNTFLSTATVIAGVSSLASPSVSSFFSSAPPSPSPTSGGSREGVFPSSFVSVILPTQSITEGQSDNDLLLTDTSTGDPFTFTLSNGKITTIGLVATGSRDREGATESNSPGPDGGFVQPEKSSDDDSGPNPALIGGIVGGIVGLILAAFLVWCCCRRRRRKSSKKARFSTRMSMPPGAEKRRTYEFDSGSVGPTPKHKKFAAALGYHANKFGWHFNNHSVQSVDITRGDPQYFTGLPSHSRENSTSSFDDKLSGKDRFLDWWSRLKEDVNFNWRLRNDRSNDWTARNMMEKDSGDMEPDFLGLLTKDEKRRSAAYGSHSRGGSFTSIDRFLGDLGMDINNTSGANPFSDAHASLPPPTQTLDPFADANAVQPTQKPPQTYVADVRRSRGASSTGAVRASNLSTTYRESMQTDAGGASAFEARRNKCRSDPFDLELDPRKMPTLENIKTMPSLQDTIYGSTLARPPTTVISGGKDGHESYGSSRFTGSDWSEPGPDVGVTGGAATAATSVSGASHKSKKSDGNQGSSYVGKAM